MRGSEPSRALLSDVVPGSREENASTEGSSRTGASFDPADDSRPGGEFAAEPGKALPYGARTSACLMFKAGPSTRQPRPRQRHAQA